MPTGVDDMNRFVATRESVLNERKQQTIGFVVAVEERTDVTCLAELGTGKGDGFHGRSHNVFLSYVRKKALRLLHVLPALANLVLTKPRLESLLLPPPQI